MSREPVARLVLTALVAGLLAACQPTSVVVQRPPIPDDPVNEDRVGKALTVAQGNGPLGPYRAWIYRTRDGLTCFDVATQGVASSSCGTGADGAVGISPLEVEGGWFVAGGTRLPAVTAVVHTGDGLEIRGPVDLAPPGVADGTSWFVIAVPDVPPEVVDLLDVDHAVIETVPLGP